MLLKIVAGIGAVIGLVFVYLSVVCPILTTIYGYPGTKEKNLSSGGSVTVAQDDGYPLGEGRRAGQFFLNGYRILAGILAMTIIIGLPLYLLGTGVMMLL